MADSPNDGSSSVLKVTVNAAGNEISEDYQLISLSVHSRINKIPSAVLTFSDGSHNQNILVMAENHHLGVILIEIFK